MNKILDGKFVSEIKNNEYKHFIDFLKNTNARIPTLVVIIIGNNPASEVYVKNKTIACEKVGINSRVISLQDNCTNDEVLTTIKELNNDPTVDGILLQLPLPKHLNKELLLESISSDKDVDGFNPINIGRMYTNQNTLLPCTPKGIIDLLDYYNIDLQGKSAVVIGRSNLVGLPISFLLTQRNATVTTCHSFTLNLKELCQQADIVVAAIGKAEFVKDDWLKEGAIVIDVGINRNEYGKLVGDVDFSNAINKVSFITPVPKGIGPMTISSLLGNTIKAYQAREDKHGV